MYIRRKAGQSGFTLMEVMVTLAIVGIVTAIAYPSYRDNTRRGSRADARGLLLEDAQYMERFFNENNAYNLSVAGSAPVLPRTVVPIGATGAKVNYTISLTAVSASAFTLTATAQNSQVNDDCKNLTITNLGQKSTTGTLTGNMTSDLCWMK